MMAGSHAKQDGAGDKAFAEILGHAGPGAVESFLGVAPERIQLLLKAQGTADQVAENEGDRRRRPLGGRRRSTSR